MNVSPGILAMYAALAWAALSFPAALLIGRMLRAADQTATRCHCGSCDR